MPPAQPLPGLWTRQGWGVCGLRPRRCGAAPGAGGASMARAASTLDAAAHTCPVSGGRGGMQMRRASNSVPTGIRQGRGTYSCPSPGVPDKTSWRRGISRWEKSRRIATVWCEQAWRVCVCAHTHVNMRQRTQGLLHLMASACPHPKLAVVLEGPFRWQRRE